MRARKLSPVPGIDEPQMSVRPLWSASMYVIDSHGRADFERICEQVDIGPDHLLDNSQWVSMRQASAFLQAVRALVPNEDAFKTRATTE